MDREMRETEYRQATEGKDYHMKGNIDVYVFWNA